MVLGKFPPGKSVPGEFPPGKLPPGKFPPRKFSPGIFPLTSLFVFLHLISLNTSSSKGRWEVGELGGGGGGGQSVHQYHPPWTKILDISRIAQCSNLRKK